MSGKMMSEEDGTWKPDTWLLEETASRTRAAPAQSALDSIAGDLIPKFLELTYRKVSLRDEYGEENWEALDTSLDTLMGKILARDGVTKENSEQFILHGKLGREGRYWHKGHKARFAMPAKYLDFRNQLQDKFKEYFAEAQAHRADTRSELETMTGVEFEAYLKERFEALGYMVTTTPNSGDQGADLILAKGGRRIAVQAKRSKAPVGNAAVQEVAAAVMYYEADTGAVATNSTFTKSAEELAGKNEIVLIDGSKLQRLGDYF